MGFLIPPHPLTNFEIQKYYKNERRFNGIFSRNNLSRKIKDGAYIISLDEYANVGTYWTALFGKKNEIIYFDSFGAEYISNEIKGFIKKIPGKKNIKTNIFRVQENNFNNGWAGKKLTDYTNLFSPHDLKKKR